MTLQKPSKEELDAINMRLVADRVLSQSQDKQYIQMPAGKEHYRLLVWLGMQFRYIVELGTYRGHSAVALAVGAKESGAFVESFDIENHKDIIDDDDLELLMISKESCFGDDEDDYHRRVDHAIENANMIFLDTFHDGTYERVVLKYLRDIKWKGVLVMDDIFLNNDMREVWSEITERKEDWTDIGHWSGTGIVYFE